MTAQSKVRTLLTVSVVSIAAACSSNAAPKVAPTLAPPAEAKARQAGLDVYMAQQVTKPVTFEQGGATPHYPDVLRAAKIEGMVLMSFVVDLNGKIDMPSALVLSTTDERFLPAVIATLPYIRFTPAEFEGHRVKQLVSQPYYFHTTDSTGAHGAQTINQAVKTLSGAPIKP